MKTTADFLDALRIKLNLPSDGQLADHLGMHRQHMSRYRTMSGTFDDERAIQIADILEVDPVFVVACMHAQRAKREEEKAVWSRVAAMVSGVSAAVFVAVILSAVDLPTDAMNGAALAGFSDSTGIYIMRKSK
jgi:predicted transcriptional regulator